MPVFDNRQKYNYFDEVIPDSGSEENYCSLFTADGEVRFKGECREGKPWKGQGYEYQENRTITEYWVDGEVVRRFYPFVNDGYNEVYNANRQILYIGEFKGAKLWEGKCYKWSDDGLLINIELYKEGKFDAYFLQ